MDGLQSFLSPSHPSLKICGVTLAREAEQLAQLKVPGLGINFWPQSKRFCPAHKALTFLPTLANEIVRVGVFVNNAREIAPNLLKEKALDIIQLHGDEDDDELLEFLTTGTPVIRSLALKTEDDLEKVIAHHLALSQKSKGTLALLLDAHAPGLYGGTGKTIDWNQAAEFIQLSPLPVLLAGGIVPSNAQEAAEITKPAALDVASGAESSPGTKDFDKVSALLAATHAGAQS